MKAKIKRGKMIVKMSLEERDNLLPVLNKLSEITETILEEDEFHALKEIISVIS